MRFLHFWVALTALAKPPRQHYLPDIVSVLKETKMYKYKSDPLYQSHVLTLIEIEDASRRARKLRSLAFMNAVQNLYETLEKPVAKTPKSIQMPLPSSKGFA